jgi:single-stranded DNA-specific DHH superfamily exonuclease
MSIESAAELVAGRILEEKYLEVYGHNDADGIAAAGILCHALARAGMQFRLRIVREVTEGMLSPGTTSVLCDLGGGMGLVPEDTIVIDHHVPHFSGKYHVNPNLAGINGESELSAAGAGYLVAECMGNNQDLAGLVVAGIFGDGQEVAGKNREIVNDGIAESVIIPRRGIPLAGKTLEEQLLLSVSPFLPGISGDEHTARQIAAACQDPAEADAALALVVLRTSRDLPVDSLLSLWKDIYDLPREIIPGSCDLTAVLDACGRSGEGGLGASICLRHQGSIEQAWLVMQEYRRRVIATLRGLHPQQGPTTIVEIQDPGVLSSVADALIPFGGLIVVMARSGEQYRLTARCPPDSRFDLERLTREVAQEFGGNGGGHRCRTGATFPAKYADRVRKRFMEAAA